MAKDGPSHDPTRLGGATGAVNDSGRGVKDAYARLSRRRAARPYAGAVDARELQAAWTILREALPGGWRVYPPAYDPDNHRWSVWAVARPPTR